MSDCSFSCNPETPPHQLLLRMTSQMLRLLQRKKNQIFLTPPLTQRFGRLLTALEHEAEASPIMDAPLYTVLSRLSHAHPWTSLILDLKDLMPDLDRHYHHQLLVAMLQHNPPHITPFIVVDQFLYCLAITITNILTPPNSQVDPPEIDSFFFHPTFWHRHLIHGTNLASPSFL